MCRLPKTHMIDNKRPGTREMKITRAIVLLGTCCAGVLALSASEGKPSANVGQTDRARILRAADSYLQEKPLTITSCVSAKSAGGEHDFFSESDYWWPNPKNPDGPYIRRDGMTNPDNFVEHRLIMRRFCIQMPALTAAYLVTKDAKYAEKAAQHLRAWFVNEETRMNPSLQFAQAVKGVSPGRGVGVIDALHLVEVARAVRVLEREGMLDAAELRAIKKWFREYLQWLTTSKNGIEEREQDTV